MLIRSKFIDYYDNGAINGIDTTRLYLRETREEKFELIYKEFLPENNLQIIGFCGKLYVLLNYSQSPVSKENLRDPKEYVLWGEDILKYSFIEERYTLTYTLKKVERSSVECQGKYSKDQKKRSLVNLTNFLTSIVENKELKSLFLKYKTPVFQYALKSKEVIISPKLSDYAFFRIKTTTEAFQEIEMYLSNVLTNTESAEMPVGSDLDILKSKGFDPKLSFRKEKK